MPTVRLFLLTFLAIVISGCAITNLRIQMAAAPLESVADAKKNVGGSSSDFDAIHDMVQDSQTKCADFVTMLFARAGEVNTNLDISSTIFSSLATVAIPNNTVHALSAASTISSGAKSSISLESLKYLNSITISHIAQAIQLTYTTDISKYLKYLDDADQSTLHATAERSTILSFHNECSLPAADGSITSSLQPQQQQATGPLSLTYTVSMVDTDLKTLSSNIVSTLNSDKGFQGAQVAAAVDKNTGDITFTIPSNFVLKQNPFMSPAGTANAGETTKYSNGPPVTLTIGGKIQQGDTLTLEIDSQTPQTNLAAPPAATAPANPAAKLPAQRPDAAVLGVATWLKGKGP